MADATITPEVENEVSGYGDLLTQRVSRFNVVRAGQLADNFGGFNAQINNFEVVGPQFWDTVPAGTDVVVELVDAAVMHDTLRVRDSDGETAWGQFHADTSSGFGPSREGTNTDYGPETFEVDSAGDDLTLKGGTQEDHKYLHSANLTVQPTLFDTTNSAGAGASNSNQQWGPMQIPYRERYGRGPLFDTSHDVFFAGYYYKDGVMNGKVEHITNAELTWDVFAQQQRPLKEMTEGSWGGYGGSES